MPVRAFKGVAPRIAASAWVDPAALVIGDVTIGEQSSLWPMAVARGDVQRIHIGARTNIQDACILHVTHDSDYAPGGVPLRIGDDVTVGHRVILHACTVGNRCLIGMGATVMDGAVLGDELIIGAASLVPAGKQLEGGYLYMGVPVKQVRALTERELGFLSYSAEHYAQLAREHGSGDPD